MISRKQWQDSYDYPNLVFSQKCEQIEKLQKENAELRELAKIAKEKFVECEYGTSTEVYWLEKYKRIIKE